jgi:hypothetical protein
MTTDTPPEDLPKRKPRKTPVEKAVDAVLALTIADLPEFANELEARDARAAEYVRVIPDS